jgi:Domain of unknown function (DUF4249)
MKSISFLIDAAIAVILLTSCEDVVQVDVAPANAQLVVDAFLTNRDTAQTIRLTQTVPYFFQDKVPTVSGAEVILKNRTTGRDFVFADTKNDGIYAWQPQGKENIGDIGHAFQLTVRHQNETFVAESRLSRTTVVDSVTYESREEGQDPETQKEGYYATFYGRDAVGGPRDYYWIRSYKNGVYQSRVFNFAADGFGGETDGGDGFPFIPPLQNVTDGRNPAQVGDTIRVELWSVTRETFGFLEQAQRQITNGGLFAVTPENVRTNLKNVNPNSKTKAVGWFCTSVVSGLSVKVEEK